jgi:hypothetical protein
MNHTDIHHLLLPYSLDDLVRKNTKYLKYQGPNMPETVSADMGRIFF